MHTIPFNPTEWSTQFLLPDPNSHKGQNGKLMIIGGSQLFHAASKWSLDIASKFVDMVFYASTPDNNELVRQAKLQFWNGIVIERAEVAHYVNEADCILIGPGMERTDETAQTVRSYLEQYPDKKWVIDAGALQMIVPSAIPSQAIITPHPQELLRLAQHNNNHATLADTSPTALLALWSDTFTDNQPVTVIKGQQDLVLFEGKAYVVSGGNAGMTKGGTGDVLAGLVAALYCTNSAHISALFASHANKQAGDLLHATVGPFFNASDLVEAVPKVLWQSLQ
jgi:hydroxyethylthiazole kinase-like uncharacterized protein yjeF